MGLYIKNMEMPKYGCDHCFLRTGNYCGRIEKNEPVVEYARKSERHPDCPLVPVPSHGRCIDADALTEKLKKHREYHLDGSSSGAAISNGIGQCLDIINGKECPTIISAEEAET